MNKRDAIFSIALAFMIVLQFTPFPFDDILLTFFSFMLGWKKTFQLIVISSLIYGVSFWRFSLFASVLIGVNYFIGMTTAVLVLHYLPSKTLKTLRKKLSNIQ